MGAKRPSYAPTMEYRHGDGYYSVDGYPVFAGLRVAIDA